MRLFFLASVSHANIPFHAIGFTDDVGEGRQTWEPGFGDTETSHEDFRELGALKAGYWCDQRVHTDDGDIFRIDSVGFRHGYGTETATAKNDNSAESSVDRIVGGENVQRNAWRWVGYFYGCGSTLIANDWAVTAAHCCTIPAWYFKGKPLCFGRDKRLITEKNEQCSEIAEIIQHPQYDRSETVLNDICLIRLSDKLEYNDIVQPVCLPKQGVSLETVNPSIVGDQDGANNFCYVAGWGYRQEGAYGSLPVVLQDAKINILRNETCESAYTEVLESGRTIQYFRRSVMSCAGHLEGAIDACQGDSGGPLICLEESKINPGHYNPVLRGVVSWGEGCARAGKPGVYARVSEYIDWIQETIKVRARTTGDNCGSPYDVFTVGANAIVDCSYNKCDVHCKIPGYKANNKSIKCDKGKFVDQKKKSLIDCAPNEPGSNFFTNCGAITSHYEIDLENLKVNCHRNKCSIKTKSKAFTPSITTVVCQRNKYNYDGQTIRAWPAGSVTKTCGPFFETFPNAMKAGLVVECKKNACYIKGPPGRNFKVEPHSKLACSRRKWMYKGSQITEDLDWRAYSFSDYRSGSYDRSETDKTAGMCGDVSLWNHIDSNEHGLVNSGAKVKCDLDAKGKMLECHFYCPPKNDDADADQIRLKFRCVIARKKWVPSMSSQLGSKLTC